jgi:hypothetical protein
MKKNILSFSLLVMMVIVHHTGFSQAAKNEYDKDVYQKRLSLTPKFYFGMFQDLADQGQGIDANYFLNKKILIQTSLGGKLKGSDLIPSHTKLDIGGAFLLRNAVITKKSKIFNRTISSTKYEVLKTNINIHKIFGLRGGYYRKAFKDVNWKDMDGIGFGKSMITYLSNTGTATSNVNQAPNSLLSGYNISLNGVYMGIITYNSRNHSNASGGNFFSKGRKNQYMQLGADLLIGGTGVRPINTSSSFQSFAKVADKKSPIGIRTFFEAGMYLSNKQDFSLHFNAELGSYPGASGSVALVSIGARFNLLDKVVSNN